LPRLSAFCEIDLPALPLESAGRHHLLALLTDLNAYMRSKSAWYHGIFSSYRTSRVTKVSNNLIDGLLSCVFSSKSSAKKHVASASSKTLGEWKRDVESTKRSLSSRGPVTLKGRAFAALLGSVACTENKWSDNPNDPVSIAGSVCTEFNMLSTPKSVTHNKDIMKVTNKSIERKATITSRSTLNRRFTSDLTTLVNTPAPAAQ